MAGFIHLVTHIPTIHSPHPSMSPSVRPTSALARPSNLPSTGPTSRISHAAHAPAHSLPPPAYRASCSAKPSSSSLSTSRSSFLILTSGAANGASESSSSSSSSSSASSHSARFLAGDFFVRLLGVSSAAAPRLRGRALEADFAGVVVFVGVADGLALVSLMAFILRLILHSVETAEPSVYCCAVLVWC
jgi:hypothetical protein